MSFTDTLLDVRNMQRAIQLRNIQDPKEVSALLERVLRDAIVAQASGSRAFERKAFNEMNQIRQDLIAGQINAGGAKDSMVGIYSHLIDQMNAMQQDNRQSSKLADNAFKQLSSSIPSADTFISALMTANPLVGYGVKIARDIMRSAKTAANNRKMERDKRLKALEKQEQFLRDQINLIDLEEANAKKEQDHLNEADKESKKTEDDTSNQSKEVYLKLLEEINANVKLLLDEWRGPDKDGSVDAAPGDNGPIIDVMDDVSDDIRDQTRQDENLSEEERKALEEMEEQRKRDSRLDRLGESGDVIPPDLNPINDQINEQTKGFGRILEGLVAPLMIMLRTGLAAFAGAAVGLFTSIVAIPALIGTAIYKFLDGFFNAEQIIGKASADITMLDRVKAGVANIWGTIIKIVDWVTNLFGFDFIDSTDMEKKLYKVFDDAQTKIVDTFNSALNYVQTKYDEITGSVTKIYDDLIKTFESVGTFVTEKFDSLTKWFTDLKDKGIIETFRDMISEDTPKQQYDHRQNDSEWRGDVPLPQGPQTYKGDVPIPGTPQQPPKVAPQSNERKVEKLPGDSEIPKIPNADKSQRKVEKANPPAKVEPSPDTTRPGIDMLPPANPNPNILRIKAEPSNGQGISSSMRTAEAKAAPSKSAGNVMVAPTTNNSTVQNHNYNGPPTTSNLDPDFRSMMG